MEIVSGTFALFAPFTLISSCTIWPTAGCESLSTAVTLGAAAKLDCIAAMAIGAKSRIRRNIDIFINLPRVTNHYRHGVGPCVHQAELVVLRPSSTSREARPVFRSSVPLFPPPLRLVVQHSAGFAAVGRHWLLCFRRPIF